MSAPVIVTTQEELEALTHSWVEAGETIAFVPTMGALHQGHLALVEQASQNADRVVVSIFVNPLQFGTGEDFNQYPRDIDKDARALGDSPADLVFAPTVSEIYPEGPGATATQSAGVIGRLFEGASRPGHFDGMLTVVYRLFDLVKPDVAVFGQKDAQQLFLISQMVDTLALPIRIVGVETVRGSDDLALSSRNAYLSPSEHQIALAIPQALDAAGVARNSDEAKKNARAVLEKSEGLEADYIEIVDPDSFLALPPGSPAHQGRLIIAALVGSTRLIDNQLLTFG